MRDNFLIIQNHYKLIKALPLKEQGQLYIALMNYGFEGVEPDLTKLSILASAVFENLKPSINIGIQRYDNCVKNGKKGGNPNFKKGQKNPYYDNQKNNLEDNQTHNQEDNQIVQPKEITKQDKQEERIKNKEYIMDGNYILSSNDVCVRTEEQNSEKRKPFLNYWEKYWKPYGNVTIPESHLKVFYQFVDTVISIWNCVYIDKIKVNGHSYNKEEFLDKIELITEKRMVEIMNYLLFADNIGNLTSYIIGCVFNYNSQRKNEKFPKLLKELERDYEFKTD